MSLILPVLLLVQQAPAPMPPADWGTMPPLPLPARALASPDAAYVRDEVAAGRCAAPARAVLAPVAVLLGPRAEVQRIVPQAIGCPTVEQYSVGYASTLLRALGDGGTPPAPGWYRLAITWRW